MVRGRWKESDENLAAEIYAVLMQGRRATRSYPKSFLLENLKWDGVYQEFLKYCVEHDRFKDMRHFRKGLLLVVKSMGPTEVANKVGISRVTLYRMLSKGGNPRLSSLITLFKALKIKMFVVDDDFLHRKVKHIRPKDR